MSAPRTVLVAAAAWLAVVAAGSVLVWTVISRAGEVETGSRTAVPAATGGGPTAPASSASPGGTGAGGADGSAPGPGAGPAGGLERRTWQGPGGYVSVQCRAAVISLVSAQADVGFVVAVERRGPDQVRVVFEGQGEEGRETRVVAECRAGVPVLEASTED